MIKLTRKGGGVVYIAVAHVVEVYEHAGVTRVSTTTSDGELNDPWTVEQSMERVVEMIEIHYHGRPLS